MCNFYSNRLFHWWYWWDHIDDTFGCTLSMDFRIWQAILRFHYHLVIPIIEMMPFRRPVLFQNCQANQPVPFLTHTKHSCLVKLLRTPNRLTVREIYSHWSPYPIFLSLNLPQPMSFPDSNYHNLPIKSDSPLFSNHHQSTITFIATL